MPKSTESAQTSANAVKRLNEAITLLRKANLLLQKIDAGWSVPDAPEQPPLLEVLNVVKTEATQAAAVTKRLIGTLGKT